jgi:hypothetical protein
VLRSIGFITPTFRCLVVRVVRELVDEPLHLGRDRDLDLEDFLEPLHPAPEPSDLRAKNFVLALELVFPGGARGGFRLEISDAAALPRYGRR